MSNLADLLTTTSGVAGPLSGGLFKEVTDGSRYPYMIPSIYSINTRNNSNAGAWSSGDGWTSFYTYGGAGWPDAERGFWWALSTHREDTPTYAGMDPRAYRQLHFAGGTNLRTDGFHIVVPNNTSYEPIAFRVTFLRNFSAQDRTRTIWWRHSSYWSSGYDGSSVWVGTPNSSTYSGATGISWASVYNDTGWNGWSRDDAFNVTIPANRTVVVLMMNSMYYYTSSSGYWYYDNNGYYNLDDTFADYWIQPDLRMTWTAWTYSQLNDFTYNGQTAHQVWNRCAALFGDR